MRISEFLWPDDRVVHIGVEGTMKPPIPKTDSIEELARFWDTHDLTDYWDELPEVPSPFRRRSDAVRIVLSPEEREAVRKLAASQGVEETILIHEWVKEKIHHP